LRNDQGCLQVLPTAARTVGTCCDCVGPQLQESWP
jgi:hypothetical protein